MKKILLATTLIAASTGYAAAEVAVSGSARMGIISTNGSDAAFTQRIRINFSATGETDNGLAFGGSVRNDQMGNGNTANGDSTVFISGAFGKITMGDVSGAADALVGQVSSVGLTGNADGHGNSINEIGFLGNKKTAALYTYSAGALTFGVGLGQTSGATGTTGAAKAKSVAVKYSTDAYTAALGYEDVAGDEQTSVLGSTTFSGVTVKAKYASRRTASSDAWALSADYAMSGVGLTAFYSNNYDWANAGHHAYGLGASYDLGGGAAIKGGVTKSNEVGFNKANFDLGVSMSF